MQNFCVAVSQLLGRSSKNSVSNHWLSISLKNAEEADGTMIVMDYFSLVGK